MSTDVITVAEAANALRVSKMTIYRMIKDGQLPSSRVRTTHRIPAAAVRRIVADAAWSTR